MDGTKGINAFINTYFKKQHWKRKLLFRYALKKTIEKDFLRRKGVSLNLMSPQTLDEKLQWFKMYVKDPMLTKCADKYAVREYVEKKIGKEYLVPLLGVYDRVEDIKLEDLPEAFVLKPTHMSGEVILCHEGEKDKINWGEKADQMKYWLRTNYYYMHGEWQYKNILPKIICEKLLKGDVVDYKFFCINSNPILAEVIGSRENGHYNDAWVDLNFNPYVFIPQNNMEKFFEKPTHWKEMIQIAKLLAAEFPFVRVDLYDLEGKIFFGELTFTPANGMSYTMPPEKNVKMGEMYDLSPFLKELQETGKVTHWCKKEGV